MSESKLLRACLDRLALVPIDKCLYWRQNSGSVFLKGRKITLGPPGMPDICMVVPWIQGDCGTRIGAFIGLELKAKSGTQRESQVLIQKRLESIGGFYYVVRSLDDLETIIKAWCN